MAEDKKKKKKCKVVTTLVCGIEGGIDGNEDELKTTDIAVNSRKSIEILKNFFKKQLGDKYEEDDTI